MVKFAKEYKHAIPMSNLLRNTSMQYLVKFTKE